MSQASEQKSGCVGESKSDVRGEKKRLSSEEEDELEKIVKLRRTNPELIPSMFLWKDFGKSFDLFSIAAYTSYTVCWSVTHVLIVFTNHSCLCKMIVTVQNYITSKLQSNSCFIF